MVSMVGIECFWTGIFASLQIGTLPFTYCLAYLILEIIAASIFITLAGPPEYCGTRAPLAFCASATILVPISWMAATLRERDFALLRTRPS
jgi:hypothetical protein